MTYRLLRVAEARSWAPAVVVTPPPSGGAGSVAQVIADMYSATGPWNANKGAPWNKSDATPSGAVEFPPMSGFSWYGGADNYATAFPVDGDYINLWFEVFKTVESPAGPFNMAVEVKTPSFQFLISNVWSPRPAPANPEAHIYNGRFASDHGAQTRTAQSGDGATAFSWPLNNLANGGTPGWDALHGWWDTNSYALKVANMTAIHCSCQMRLISNGGSSPTTGKFIGCMGSDKIRTPTTNYQNVGGYGQSRLKFLTDQWQPFSFTTPLSAAQITANPPALQVAS